MIRMGNSTDAGCPCRPRRPQLADGQTRDRSADQPLSLQLHLVMQDRPTHSLPAKRCMHIHGMCQGTA